ncbi:MAG: DUF3987 domain-containing protein, partial [Stackebrandtia sp.]
MNDHETPADWGSKYTGAVVRLAALLHLVEHHRAANALAAFEDMG